MSTFGKLEEFASPAKTTYFFKEFGPYLLLDTAAIGVFTLLAFLIFKSNKPDQIKKLGVGVLFTLLTFIITFSFFEAYFRFIYDEPDGLGFLKVSQRWTQRHVQLNNYDINFFRDRKFTLQKKEGVTRIGVIGDSLTFGAGIEDPKDRFSDILEKKLNENNFNVEVYNLGIPGNDTEQEIKLYNHVKELNFDVIVWEYFLNDIQPEANSSGTEIISKNRQQGKIAQHLSKRSYFFDYLYWHLSLKYHDTLKQLRYTDLNQYKNKIVLENHIKNINSFIDELTDENKKIIIIMFPSLALMDNHKYEADFANNINKKIFADKSIKTIDLLPDLITKDKKDLVAGRYDNHPNEFVHALAAQRLLENIQDLLKQ